MASRAPSGPVPSAAAETAVTELVNLDSFIEPDDQGISLNELSQAYAAILAKGADPYIETPPATEETVPIAAVELIGPTIRDPVANDNCQVTPRSILEAILFVGHPTGDPLTSERIAGLMRGVRPEEIDDLVRELNIEYATAGAPYAIVSVGPGYQLALRPEFGSLRDAFHGRIREARLSATAVDILAIVAYHQPITADEVERLRGKSSAAVLAQLLRRDLLAIERPEGKKSKPQYRTTSRFLDLFGLENLAELPRSDDLQRDL